MRNKEGVLFCHKLRKTTTRKKGAIARKSTKKSNKKDSSIRYIVAIIIVILSVLGMFQLGIVGRMIDSFFNYLFGMSRYLTYILLSLITVYIAMQKKFPKTRRTFGLISLQFVLLITTQIIYHFQKVQHLKENLFYPMCIRLMNIVIFRILVGINRILFT